MISSNDCSYEGKNDKLFTCIPRNEMISSKDCSYEEVFIESVNSRQPEAICKRWDTDELYTFLKLCNDMQQQTIWAKKPNFIFKGVEDGLRKAGYLNTSNQIRMKLYGIRKRFELGKSLGSDRNNALAKVLFQNLLPQKPLVQKKSIKDEIKEPQCYVEEELNSVEQVDVTDVLDGSYYDESINDSQQSVDIRIIQAVQSKPALWDPNHYEYKSNVMHNWQEVANMLSMSTENLSVEHIRKKWKSFRTGYQRSKQKNENSKYKYGKLMSFLEHKNNLNTDDYIDYEDTSDPIQQEVAYTSGIADVVHEKNPKRSSSSSATQKKKPTDQLLDDCDHFGCQIAESLRKFPRLQQNKLKLQLLTLMYEAEETLA